jgi:hypothetical protein
MISKSKPDGKRFSLKKTEKQQQLPLIKKDTFKMETILNMLTYTRKRTNPKTNRISSLNLKIRDSWINNSNSTPSTKTKWAQKC